MRRNKSTEITMLDLEKAFDTVWHNGLTYNIFLASILQIFELVAAFPTGRTSSVAVNKTLSLPSQLQEVNFKIQFHLLYYTPFTLQISLPHHT